MLTIIQMLLSRLIKDPTTLAILMNFIQELLNYGSKLAKPALVYIVEASGMDISASERFTYVYEKMKVDFPDVTGSFIRSVIESTYTAWNAGKLI